MPDVTRLAEWLWYGGDPMAVAGRGVLAPAEGMFRVAVGLRAAAFRLGLAAEHRAPIPVVSVGNISVGGTGKTPLASWVAGALQARGARPAVVLRGYGGDEPEVHRLLRPGVGVVTDPDRVRGVAAAAAAGADVAVLDDAFQHRRVARQLDVVLVSADRPWATRCLPAGPLREPVAALARADVVVVTRKAAAMTDVARVAARAREAGAPLVVACGLVLEGLQVIAGEGRGVVLSLEALRGAPVLAVSGIGDPSAWHAQLRAAGAEVHPLSYADHHAYDAGTVASIMARVPAGGRVVCTLKDAVKLQALWPRSGPALWYVSQRVEPLEGWPGFERALDAVWPAPSVVRRP